MAVLAIAAKVAIPKNIPPTTCAKISHDILIMYARLRGTTLKGISGILPPWFAITVKSVMTIPPKKRIFLGKYSFKCKQKLIEAQY